MADNLMGTASEVSVLVPQVWSSNYYSGDRTVDVYIAKLREKLKSIARDIRTVKGVGYKLDGESWLQL